MKYPKWKLILIAIVVALGAVYAAPNFVPSRYAYRLPAWLKPVTLGLDLQGGSQILLEVKTDNVIAERLDSFRQTAAGALRKAGIRYTDMNVADGKLTMKIIDSADVPAALDATRRIDRDSFAVGSRQGTLTVEFAEAARTALVNRVMDQSVEIVRRRIDRLGTTEPSIQRQGATDIQVQLPGVEDPETVKALLGKTAKMAFHFVDERTSAYEARQGNISPESFIMPGDDGDYVLEKSVIVGGENLIDAQADYQGGMPVVAFRFDTIGAAKFGKATRENVGRRLAIALDGKVISAPVVQSPITGGRGVITGRFTTESAAELSMLLRGGALPAPLEVVEERTVGPGLGSDSIRAGQISCVIAIVLVMLFMVGAYGKLGLVANAALIVNAALLLGALSALGATLTLPGLAGIALTIGMAVDANVLIYERMREEMALGRSSAKVIESGFSNALSAILDSNITTLAAALFLFMFGYGPVRGFGVTLGLGILTSMFTAVMVTRAIMSLTLNKWKNLRI